VQCQAPVVWVTLDRAKPDGLGTVAISTTIRIAEAAVRRSLSLLERHEMIDSYRVSRQIRYRAIGECAPNWKTFMQLNSRRECDPPAPALRHAGI
jgi:DNA-binding transcriptional ArsR family regulator